MVTGTTGLRVPKGGMLRAERRGGDTLVNWQAWSSITNPHSRNWGEKDKGNEGNSIRIFSLKPDKQKK